MKEKVLRLNRVFNRGSDDRIYNAAKVVLANLYGNPAFPDPPIPENRFSETIEEFSNAKAATAQGGTRATAEKKRLRAVLNDRMIRLGLYVEIRSKNKPAVFLSSGFIFISPNRAQSQLPPPTGLRTQQKKSGCMLLTVSPVKNAKLYEAQYSLLGANHTPGRWRPGAKDSSSRNIPIKDLIPGRLYNFRIRALGGSTGSSDWSVTICVRAW